MKKLVCLLAVAFVLAASVGPAEARRRIRIPFFGGGSVSSETIVLVQDLPDKPKLLWEDNQYIDLGYLFSPSGDKWVGHIGSSSRYLPLDEAQLRRIMAIAGLKTLPPTPERPVLSSMDDMFSLMFWGLVAACVIAGIIGKVLMRGKEDDQEIIDARAMQILRGPSSADPPYAMATNEPRSFGRR